MLCHKDDVARFAAYLLEEHLPDPAHGLDEDDAVGAAPRREGRDDGREFDVHRERRLPLQLELHVVGEHPLLLVHSLHPQQDVGEELGREISIQMNGVCF